METLDPKANPALQEDTAGHSAPNVGPPTDENLSMNQMFQQGALPSLGRQIFSVIPMHGPTAALINVRRKAGTDDIEVVRNEVEVYPSEAIHTGITPEAVQDIRAQYGEEATQLIGVLLRGLANEQENTRTLAFLEAQSLVNADLQLSDSLNGETNLFEINQKISELVLQMNTLNMRTFQSYAVVPYKPLTSVMNLSRYVGATDKGERGLFIADIGQTKFFMNPDPDSSTCYVGLKDHFNPTKSSAVFSPYVANVVDAVDYNTGEMTYHIYNRFAITASPLHEAGNEMFHKFDILL